MATKDKTKDKAATKDKVAGKDKAAGKNNVSKRRVKPAYSAKKYLYLFLVTLCFLAVLLLAYEAFIQAQHGFKTNKTTSLNIQTESTQVNQIHV